VVENSTLDLEAEGVARLRETVRDEQTSRNFSLFDEPISKAQKIVARKSSRFNLFAHFTICRLHQDGSSVGRKPAQPSDRYYRIRGMTTVLGVEMPLFDGS
jgi:hypothetical protein